MKILLVNDDGIYASGLLTLAKKLTDGHDVTVVAPQQQMSGMSHSISFYGYVNYTRLDIIDGVECYAVNGTPSDCVKIALNLIFKDRPDLIISGINKGFNLGTDVLYSGTLNAALEGAVHGVKAIAISQEYGIEDFEFSADFLYKNLDRLFELLPDDAQTVFNINIPTGDKSEINGIKFCRIGVKHYRENYQYDENLGYRLKCEVSLGKNNTSEDDVILYEKNYITVSAVKNDWNDYAVYADVRKEELEL